jgi:Cu+-exporting ATPase
MKKTIGAVLACVVCLVGCQAEPSGGTEEATPAAASATPATPAEAAASKTVYRLGGMTCVSCANTIREGVMKLDGVKLATVMFADEELVVDWAPGAQADDAAVVEAVVELGYEAEVK